MKNSEVSQPLGERAEHLLRVLIEQYVRDGQPISSRALARDAGLKLSPASIRNVMADLEELGLLHSPHTSAGRVPTVQGYRMFVDSLLTVQPLARGEIDHMQAELSPDQNAPELLDRASKLLSEVSQLAGIVMLPKEREIELRQIEFLSLSDNRVLVIIVVNNQEVQNRVMHTTRTYSESELREAANYINDICVGKNLSEARRRLLQEMADARQSMNQMMIEVIETGEDLFSSGATGDYVLAGQNNLMEFAELSNVERLRHLFDSFNEKRDILHLLDQALGARGVQIFIGEESGYDVLDDCSVVTSPYEVDGRILGVLGVIGPTRMAYDRVIPIVDMTAKMLSTALRQGRS